MAFGDTLSKFRTFSRFAKGNLQWKAKKLYKKFKKVAKKFEKKFFFWSDQFSKIDKKRYQSLYQFLFLITSFVKRCSRLFNFPLSYVIPAGKQWAEFRSVVLEKL